MNTSRVLPAVLHSARVEDGTELALAISLHLRDETKYFR